MLTLKSLLTWLFRIVAAIIMLQSLFFKFSGADVSIYIFSRLGMEPWGRIGTGIIELISAVLILIPRTTWLGAALGLGTMSGAIFFHLTTLGIEVNEDGGQLFVYAVITWVCCILLLAVEREKIQKFVAITFTK